MKKLIISFLLAVLIFSSINTIAYGFGFKKNNKNEQPEIGKYQSIIDGTNSYYVGNKDEKVIYLTFDAGYDNGNMSIILDILKEKNVKATFFLTGDFFIHEDLIKRMANEKHLIGNHTTSHKNIIHLTEDDIREELSKVEQRYFNITGETMPKFFRPPEGEFDHNSLMIVKNLGFKTFFWSIAFNDWNVNKQKGKQYAYDNVINNLHNGAIILLHSVSTDNTEALPEIIDSARKLGYQFNNLDEFKQ